VEDSEALGRSRGGLTTKIHLRSEGGGKPIAILVTAGQRHEQSAFRALMETGAVKQAGRGRPRIRPERVVGDKGYSGEKIRSYLRGRGIGAVIARQDNEKRKGASTKKPTVGATWSNDSSTASSSFGGWRRGMRNAPSTTGRCSPSRPSYFGREIENRP
jgi:hypothetical protein